MSAVPVMQEDYISSIILHYIFACNGPTVSAWYLQAALELDVEDINAFCQRQDALSLLKRMPKAPPRVAATPTGMDTDMSASDVCDSSSSPDTTAGIA